MITLFLPKKCKYNVKPLNRVYFYTNIWPEYNQTTFIPKACNTPNALFHQKIIE